jgi:hypothetical protein
VPAAHSMIRLLKWLAVVALASLPRSSARRRD